MILNAMAGGASTPLGLSVKSYATQANIPSSGSALLIEFAIISNIACPSIDSGGIVLAPALSSPTTRLDGSAFQDGDCILSYASIGNTTININNIFKIRVIGVQQRQSGAFVKVAAKVSNHGAAFVSVESWFYYLGEEYASLTGGWRSITTGTTRNTDNLYFFATGSSGSPGQTSGWYMNQIDVTDLSTIHIISKRDSSKTGSGRFNLTTNISSALLAQTNALAYLTLSTNTVNTEQTLDVTALSGLLYPCFSGYTASSTLGNSVYDFWAE